MQENKYNLNFSLRHDPRNVIDLDLSCSHDHEDDSDIEVKHDNIKEVTPDIENSS